MIITNGLKNFVSLLNQPTVKQSVKNVAGFTTYLFGLVEICDFSFQIGRHGIKYLWKYESPSKTWSETASRVADTITRTSLILSIFTTPPALVLSRVTLNLILTPDQQLRFFGPNLNFAQTPYHPRHVVSLVSFALGVPATVSLLVDGGRKIKALFVANTEENVPVEKGRLLSSYRAKLFAAFNTFTSRPVLHGCNYIARRILFKSS